MDTRSQFELRSLVGQRVFFRTPGLSGILEDVRVDGFLLVALSAPGRAVFGRGYLHASSLMPVERFPVHCSVLTQYGRGRVLAVEVRPIVGVVYTVAMQECRLTGGALATAYLAAPSVRASPNSAAEIALLKCVAEAEGLRLQGNAAFKASNFDAAIAAYERANTRVMQQVNATESSDVNPAIGDILKDVLVKGHNNLANSLMRKGDHDSMLAALGVAQQVRGHFWPPLPPPSPLPPSWSSRATLALSILNALLSSPASTPPPLPPPFFLYPGAAPGSVKHGGKKGFLALAQGQGAQGPGTAA